MSLKKRLLLILFFMCFSSPAFAVDAPSVVSPPSSENNSSFSHKSFDECASAFFSPDMLAQIEKLGLHVNSNYLYAWYVDVAQRFIPREYGLYDWTIKKNKPFFDENAQGWKDYIAFIDSEIKPFLETYKEQGTLHFFFINAPDLNSTGSTNLDFKSISTLSAPFQITFIPKDKDANPLPIENKRYNLKVIVAHVKADNSLKIIKFKAEPFTD